MFKGFDAERVKELEAEIKNLEGMHRGVCESNKRLRAELAQAREEAINAAMGLNQPIGKHICDNNLNWAKGQGFSKED